MPLMRGPDLVALPGNTRLGVQLPVPLGKRQRGGRAGAAEQNLEWKMGPSMERQGGGSSEKALAMFKLPASPGFATPASAP